MSAEEHDELCEALKAKFSMCVMATAFGVLLVAVFIISTPIAAGIYGSSEASRPIPVVMAGANHRPFRVYRKTDSDGKTVSEVLRPIPSHREIPCCDLSVRAGWYERKPRWSFVKVTYKAMPAMLSIMKVGNDYYVPTKLGSSEYIKLDSRTPPKPNHRPGSDWLWICEGPSAKDGYPLWVEESPASLAGRALHPA